MTGSVKDGGPAFPTLPTYDGEGYAEQSAGGMTLHDFFVAKALAGFCANPSVYAANDLSGWSLVNCSPEQLVGECRRLADAAIAARSK